MRLIWMPASRRYIRPDTEEPTPMPQSRIQWTAPSERTDGTPLNEDEIDALVYDLGWQPLGQPDQNYTIIASLPGTLNPEGKYEVQIADLSLPEADVDIAMRCTDAEGRQSGWSNEAQVFGAAGPRPPQALTVV